MGGRGSGIRGSQQRPHVLSVTTAPYSGEVTVFQAKRGASVRNADIPVSRNGATVVLTPRGRVKTILFGNQHGKTYKAMNSGGHRHKKLGADHTHDGYVHDEYGTRHWSKAEKRIYYSVKEKIKR